MSHLASLRSRLPGRLPTIIKPLAFSRVNGIATSVDIPPSTWPLWTLHDTDMVEQLDSPATGTEPASDRSSKRKPAYWHAIPQWRTITQKDFLSYRWQTANTIEKPAKLFDFLFQVLPDSIPSSERPFSATQAQTKEAFIKDVAQGMSNAPMSTRLTPHVLSIIDWTRPLEDPVFRQFIPLKSQLLPDHPRLSLDSLHETADSPVPGLVHRYPDKVLFLATSVCPVYCRFCTRSYAVGANTELVSKQSMKPTRKRWEAMFEYIEKNPQIQDVVVSGGDSYYLQPEHLALIGDRLFDIPHIARFRFATKGLAVCPSRLLDHSDRWGETLIDLSRRGRQLGKQMAVHTHFNHPNEITWVTDQAARRLFQEGVIVRNQSVLLRGVNDNVETMSTLIRKLADLNIQPYYVYQADMVRGVEDMRTPLSVILDMEKKIRGTIAGFAMPSFVVDLPGGGGKRLASTYESYDEGTGISTFRAPAIAGDQVFEYYDPLKTAGV